jgi:hypothetical protein
MVQYVDFGNGNFSGNIFMAASQLITYQDKAEYPITTADHWRVDWSHFSPDGDPLHPWHYDFFGKNLTYDADGFLTGGKVDSMQVWEGPPPEFNRGPATLRVEITDLNLSVQKLMSFAHSGDDAAFREYLFKGNDVFIGSSAADTFEGYAGKDTFTGNGGADTFIFEDKWGKDTITDFKTVGADHDVLQFGTGLFASFEDVMAHTSDVHGNAVIDLHGHGTVTLEGVAKANLHESDFQLL